MLGLGNVEFSRLVVVSPVDDQGKHGMGQSEVIWKKGMRIKIQLKTELFGSVLYKKTSNHASLESRIKNEYDSKDDD